MTNAGEHHEMGEVELEVARERLHRIIDDYIRIEAEVRALEQGPFRVVIFGSARIQPQDTIYQQVYHIARALAERGIDIITGGGPGLMDAANSAVQDLVGRESRSYGLPIDIPTLREPANTHLDVKSPHQRFSSRLDEFMRLSNAIIVAPGGIGTLLELVYVWQLLQVGLANDRPVILINRDVWNGLLTWMHEAMLSHGYVSPRDFRWITLVDDAQDVIELVSLAHDRYMRAQMEHATPGADVDRAVTRRVLTASPPPVEHPEQDVA